MRVRGRRGAVLVLTALLLTGCRLDVGTDITFDRRGGGAVAVAGRIDGATLRELDAAGVDPGLDVAAALGPDTAWEQDRVVDADGGLVLTYRRTFRDGDGAVALLDELSADVAPQDPALRLDLDVVTTTTGAVRMEGTGAVSAPATLGVRIDDVPLGPSGEELATLVDESVDATLRVVVPGRVLEHDADVAEGRELRWALPVGAPRPILLVTEAVPPWRRPVPVVLALTLLSGAAALLVRRRRSASEGEDGGGAGPAEVSPAG